MGVSVDLEEALNIVFPDGIRDLTAIGINRRLSELRSSDRALAQRVERALRPLMDILFGGRRLPWHETSRGTAYRLALLPRNLYFHRDVAILRSALGMPEDILACGGSGKIRITPLRIPSRPDIDEGVSQTLGLASIWYRCHVQAFRGVADEDGFKALTDEQRRLAVHVSRFAFARVGPEASWLAGTPVSHNRCFDGQDDLVPYHRAIALLMERNRLPDHICLNVRLYALTGHEQIITGLPALASRVGFGSSSPQVDPGEGQMSALVEGIDEFTPEDEWTSIWRNRVVPIQKRLMLSRGQYPRGQRAPSLERLREGMPLLEVWLELRNLECALNELQKKGHPLGGENPQVARALLKDLRDLLQPKGA
jgi:hypothetical protein